MHMRHLEQADRHIARGERHIAAQEERMAHLASRGHDVAEARRFLENLYASQALLIRHREEIRKELER
jgi:hypothetical protein